MLLNTSILDSYVDKALDIWQNIKQQINKEDKI